MQQQFSKDKESDTYNNGKSRDRNYMFLLLLLVWFVWWGFFFQFLAK